MEIDTDSGVIHLHKMMVFGIVGQLCDVSSSFSKFLNMFDPFGLVRIRSDVLILFSKLFIKSCF